ncbi:MAG: hypothetical protein JWR37_5437 [Mycobacterium sp.]|nr:hypothetical protein [Mycobacterium sp.]
MSRPYSGGTSRPPHYGGGDDDIYPEDYDADYDAEYDGYEQYEDYDPYGPPDRRWLWVAGTAAVILLVAVVGTIVIINGGDSATTSARIAPPASTPATEPTAPPSPSPRALPPETVSTVPPSTTSQPTETASQPTETAPPPPPATDPRTIVYSVSGRSQAMDLVTVVYTDEAGALRTDVNVTLPWTKTIVLNPGVEIGSVTATSFLSQLNCAITDAAGETVAQQSYNAIAATCNR